MRTRALLCVRFLISHTLSLSLSLLLPFSPPLRQAFRYIDDIKAGVPRTAYKGIVSLKHNGCRKFIVPTATLDANNALPH